MGNLMSKIRRSTDGATAIEYGLLAASVAMVMITGSRYLGNNLRVLFYTIGNAV